MEIITVWLMFLVTVPGAVISALQVYDWFKERKKKTV